MDTLSYALSKKYTDEVVSGMGSIKGKNCVISSIENVDGVNRVTFTWTLDDGSVRSQTMDVVNGGVRDISVSRDESIPGVVITVVKQNGTTEVATVFDAGDDSTSAMSWEKIKNKPFDFVDSTIFLLRMVSLKFLLLTILRDTKREPASRLVKTKLCPLRM